MSKEIQTYDGRVRKEDSSYFEAIKRELVRLYRSEEKGIRLARRFWEIRTRPDQTHAEERYKIIHGLA